MVGQIKDLIKIQKEDYAKFNEATGAVKSDKELSAVGKDKAIGNLMSKVQEDANRRCEKALGLIANERAKEETTVDLAKLSDALKVIDAIGKSASKEDVLSVAMQFKDKQISLGLIRNALDTFGKANYLDGLCYPESIEKHYADLKELVREFFNQPTSSGIELEYALDEHRNFANFEIGMATTTNKGTYWTY